MISRRQALKLSSATLLAGIATNAPANGSQPAAKPVGHPSGNTPRVRNIIFMVSDGMSMAVPTLAESLSLMVRQRPTYWHQLSRLAGVRHGFFDTEARNSMVTDSAAAASAWGSGVRVNNGALNWLPGNRALTPIATPVKQSGRRVGLVTTAFATHATPAGFAVALPSRNDYESIAEKYLGAADVIMGGGRPHFLASGRKDRVDLQAKYIDAGYTVYHTRNSLKAVKKATKLLGLFDDDHLPYTVDHMADPDLARAVPTLAEMSRVALSQLDSAPEGFLLQIEGARVDHAAHLNDAAGTLWDQIAFDDAIGVALEFVRDRDDTLLIVTSDHGNSNPGLNGMGRPWGSSRECFERLKGFKASFVEIKRKIDETGDDPKQSLEIIQELTGLELFEVDQRAVVDLFGGVMHHELNSQHRNWVGALGQILGNYIGIQWTGVTHTSDWMPILALGPGSEVFGHYMLNSEAFSHMMRLMGIDFVNQVPESLTRATDLERQTAALQDL